MEKNMKVTLNTKFYYMPHLDKSIYEFNVTPGYSISSIKYEWLDEVFEFEFILSKNFHKTAILQTRCLSQTKF